MRLGLALFCGLGLAACNGHDALLQTFDLPNADGRVEHHHGNSDLGWGEDEPWIRFRIYEATISIAMHGCIDIWSAETGHETLCKKGHADPTPVGVELTLRGPAGGQFHVIESRIRWNTADESWDESEHWSEWVEFHDREGNNPYGVAGK